MKQNTKRDLCNGPILSGMLLYALPLMATGILQSLYNAADTMIIGKFAGDESLAAVSSTGSLTLLIVNLFLGLSTGVLTVVARHIGAKQHQHVRQSVHTAMMLSVLCGVFLLGLGLVASEPLLKLMGTGAVDEGSQVLAKAALYMRIYFVGAPALVVYNFGASVLRAAGDTKRPLVHLTISGVTNVLLNLLFVIVLKMDVAGVALATTLSQYLSATLTVSCLVKEQSDIRLELRKLRIDSQRLKEILRMGIPSGIQSTLFSVSNVILQSTVNTFGDLYVAGNGAAGQIENIMYTSMNAFYMTTTAYTSQNFGAQKKDRIRQSLLGGLFLDFVVMLPLGLIVTFFATPLLGLFTANAVALEAGRQRMRMTTAFTFIGGSMDIFTGYLRGLGASIVPMLTTLIGVCVLRVVWLLVLFPLFGGSWALLYLCYPVTWGVTLTAHFCYSRIIKRKLLDRLPDKESDEDPVTV